MSICARIYCVLENPIADQHFEIAADLFYRRFAYNKDDDIPRLVHHKGHDVDDSGWVSKTAWFPPDDNVTDPILLRCDVVEIYTIALAYSPDYVRADHWWPTIRQQIDWLRWRFPDGVIWYGSEGSPTSEFSREDQEALNAFWFANPDARQDNDKWRANP